jgi:two-component system chemotaxis response regulator CheB
VRIALEDKGLEQGVLELGAPSLYTCPECHGTLVQIKEGRITRFRCHTGHAFTLNALLAEISESSEATLWSAVRVLQETEMVTGHLAKVLSDAGDEAARQACLHRMEQARRQAALVRQAIAETDATHPEN